MVVGVVSGKDSELFSKPCALLRKKTIIIIQLQTFKNIYYLRQTNMPKNYGIYPSICLETQTLQLEQPSIERRMPI
jgi:hypothetical protein